MNAWKHHRGGSWAFQYRTEFDTGCVEVWTAWLTLHPTPPFPVAAKIYSLLMLTHKYKNCTPVCQPHTAAQTSMLIQPSAKCSSHLMKKFRALLRNSILFSKWCLHLKRGIHSLGLLIKSIAFNLGICTVRPAWFSISEFHQGPDTNQPGFDSYTKRQTKRINLTGVYL